MKGIAVELDSFVSRAQGHVYRLCVRPQPPDSIPPLGPVVVGGKIRA